MQRLYIIAVISFFALSLLFTPVSLASDGEFTSLQLVHQKKKIKVKKGKYKLVAKVLEASSSNDCAFIGQTHVDVKYKHRRKDKNMTLVAEKSNDGIAYEPILQLPLETHRGREIVSFDALDCTSYVRIRFVKAKL